MLDVYYTKTGANTWEVAVFNQADAAPGAPFPYAAGSLLTTATLTFDGDHRQADCRRPPASTFRCPAAPPSTSTSPR